ncbi:MAG TPA: hypothetical protein VI168_03820 [Croceibacterium sp.]
MESEMIIFTIPILGILLGFFGVWTAHKQKLAKLELETRKHAAAGSNEMTAQHLGLIRELQQRVQVLERIVTEGGYDLATRIEALRDERPAGGIASRQADKSLERLR